MEKDKIIQSLTVRSGHHTYYIDVQTTADDKFLSLTEIRRTPEGYHERHQVQLSGDSIRKVIAALQATLEHFQGQSKSSMEAAKEKYPNAFKPWTKEDDLQLQMLYYEGRPASELATHFQRNPGAINARIEKLDLRHKCN